MKFNELAQKVKSDIITDDAVVLRHIKLSEDKCPRTKDGVLLQKYLFFTLDGLQFSALESRIGNLPVRYPKGGIRASLSYTVYVGKNKDGEEVRYPNVKGIEFDSQLRFVVENAQSVSVTGIV